MANNKKILLLTEGKTDIQIAKAILEAAQFPLSQIQFEAARGALEAFKKAKYRTSEFDKVFVLADADAATISDAHREWQGRLSNQEVEVLFAIPEIEAWIFADEDLLRKKLNGNASKKLNRLPLPEEIPHPKQLLTYIFKQEKDWSFLNSMDVEKAASKTPSLREFFIKIGEVLDIDINRFQNSVSTNMNRKVFASLVKEVANSDTIMYKTLDGHRYTAKEIWENIEEGTELGKQYSSDLLRIVRDMLKRQATATR